MAHACNPSYSGGKDQENRGSKPGQANCSQEPILKKTHHKKVLVEWLKVYALSSSPSTAKKEKRNRRRYESPQHSVCHALWELGNGQRLWTNGAFRADEGMSHACQALFQVCAGIKSMVLHVLSNCSSPSPKGTNFRPILQIKIGAHRD
jgi:hypothetical protein